MITYELLIRAFNTLLITIEPPGIVPFYLALTAGMSRAEKTKAARESTLIAFIILVVSALCGNFILKSLGISIPAFRVSGGLLLLFIAFQMVFDKDPKDKDASEAKGGKYSQARSIAAFPLAIPLLSGPGAISTTIMLSGKMPAFTGQMILLAIITICMAITYICMILAQHLDKFLGESGQSILKRVVGLILSAMAMQFILNGLVEGFTQGAFGS